MTLKNNCLTALTSLALVAPVMAQDVTGTITGTLGLKPAIWYVTTSDSDDLSGWRWDGNEVEVRLVGQVRRETTRAAEGTLTIVFRTEGNPTEMNISEYTISVTQDDEQDSGLDYTAGAANADLDIEALVVSDTEMALGGSFAGRLILGGAEELVLKDDVPSVTVDGNFQATIPRLPDGPNR